MAWPSTPIALAPEGVPYIFGTDVTADGQALYDEGYSEGEADGYSSGYSAGQAAASAPPSDGQIWPPRR